MTILTKKGAGLHCEKSWSADVKEVLQVMQVHPEHGLASHEASKRLLRFGQNQLSDRKPRQARTILIDQFRSIVVLVLLIVAVLAILLDDRLEGVAIFAVVAINAIIGFLTELRATRSMEALRRLGRVDTVIIRDGQLIELTADELVPGDIVALEGGDIVTADMRLIESSELQVDESALTGESLPVSKCIDKLPDNTRVMDRRNMLFKGTALTSGSGKAVIVSTGQHTELGHIADLASEATGKITPLEKRLNSLATRLIWVVFFLAVLVAAAGFITGRDTWLAIEVAIVLAVSAIPEGLPIVATIALARGMWRMARHNALIAKLSAVETLGATRVILTDKTGTLTENRMLVTSIRLPDLKLDLSSSRAVEALERLQPLLQVGVLCSNASLRTNDRGITETTGDATEIALLEAAADYGIERTTLVQQWPEIREYAFDPHTKLMATVHRHPQAIFVAVKGATEALLPLCEKELSESGERALTAESRDTWLRQAEELGAKGLRTLAIAQKHGDSEDVEPFKDLTLLGIVGLEDPPRPGVREAIARCHAAGVEVVMVTGDHGATALHIATQLGIVDASMGEEVFVTGDRLDDYSDTQDSSQLLRTRVFSRVTPEQKLRLIELYQQHGQVVAMTGDGVNDAPALKKADIGVAMGIRGTDVAKEAADIVLQDDEFGTIVRAIAYGRAIFENIRKFVVYLLSCNISEIIAVSLATLAGAPLPLLPLQILFLNLVTDVFPALALGVGEGSPDLMRQKPRSPNEQVLTSKHWQRIVVHGTIIAVTVLAAMAIAIYYLEFTASRAVTISFCTLALAQVWHVFNMRDNIGQIVNNEITRNPWVWAAIIICIVLVLAAVYIPFMANVLELEDPGYDGWLLIVGMSLIPLATAPMVRALTGVRRAFTR